MKNIILFIKGLILGVTAVIPGISFGTMALAMDVYERGIHSLKILISFHKWKKNKSLLLSSLFFISILFLGIFIAIILFAAIIETLFKNYKPFVLLTFSGVLLGSLPSLFKKYIIPHYTIKNAGKCILYAAIGAFILMLFSSHKSKEITETIVVTNITEIIRAFLFGSITAATGLLPGISGSYISLILGYYPTFLFIFSNAIIPLMLPFFIGSFIGISIIAIFLDYMLQKFPAVSYAIIYGIMISSFIHITPWEYIKAFTVSQWIIAISCMLFGILLSLFGLSLLNTISLSKKEKYNA